jgi:hypothetical protein
MFINKHRVLSALCIATLISGILLYAISREYIIIRWPQPGRTKDIQEQEKTKKKVTLHFWHHNRWHSETVDVLWPATTQGAIQATVQPLLALMEEEAIINKKTSLQSTACSLSGNEAYVSFDHAPFNKESSTLEKLMIVESILRTIRGNGITVPNVYFLVHHQALKDPHLDFSCAWPSSGFS